MMRCGGYHEVLESHLISFGVVLLQYLLDQHLIIQLAVSFGAENQEYVLHLANWDQRSC